MASRAVATGLLAGVLSAAGAFALPGWDVSHAAGAQEHPNSSADPPAQDVAGETATALAGGDLLQAAPLAGEIRLDGRLDEPAWATVPAVTDFRQQDPDEGRPASFATSVRVLFSGDRLFIGARMEDPEPGRLIARILERDLLINSNFFTLTSDDDAFFVVLDTFDDDRNAFLFATNPNGAETDALLRDEGSLNVSWDAVWQVAAAVDSGGWSAEIAIPFRQLRFAKGGPGTWGVNFERVIKRRNEIVLWKSWTRDNGGLLKVSQAGSLTGLAGLEQGLNLQIKPYALGRGRHEEDLVGSDPLEEENGASGDVGGDVKYGVTANLTLDGTVNTDFAEVEADLRQINLTRFKLFFPEKREFFLENGGLFDFGIQGFGGPPPFLLFFSRRIGLEGNAEVPIIAGGKLTGKEGPYSLGVLDVVTEESVTPVSNFTVARVLRDVGARSRVGAIVTHRAREGEAGSVALGADTHVQISQKMAFDGFLAASDEVRKETAAYRAALDFTADQWGWFAEQSYLGETFNPALGFVLRNDVNRQFGTFRVTPRPEALGLRRVDLRLNGTFVSSADWEIRDRNWRFSLTPQFDSGDQLEVGVQRDFTRLVEPFVLAEDVVFPVGDYENESVTLTLTASRNRLVSGDLRLNDFGFFSGRNWNAGGTLRLTASRHLTFEAGWDHNAIDTSDGDLTTDLGTLRVNWNLSTRLFTSALLQYDSLADAVEANVRVDFIHSPGSDLFVVLNERRGQPGAPFRSRNRALIVKLTKQIDL
jgi:hypothetical protein